jgi:DNA-binding FadR family transcriptional regulator
MEAVPKEVFAPQPLTLQTAPVQIADQLRAAIASGTLAPGTRLPPEAELASRYGVSRGTVREAMRMLAASGLVASSRGAGGGTFVTLPRAETVIAEIGDLLSLWLRAGDVSLTEINEARRFLEFECVRRAAHVRTDDDLAVILGPVDEARDPALGMDEFLAMDIEFHTAISRAAGNRVLELAMSAVHLVRPLTNAVIADLLDRHTVVSQHQSIYDAIKDRDPEAAAAAFHLHSEYLRGVFGAAVRERGDDELSLAKITAEPHPPMPILERHRPGHARPTEPTGSS